MMLAVNVFGACVVSLPSGMRSLATASSASSVQRGGGSEHHASARTLSVRTTRTSGGRARLLVSAGSGPGLRTETP